MPRRKVTGDSYADQGRSFPQSDRNASEAIRGAGVEVLLATEAPYSPAVTALIGLATHDEGWVRIVSHEFGKVMYYKFKFSRGPYAGKYVFYHDTDLNPERALAALLAKVRGVYEGSIKPTNDTPYD